MTRLTTGAFQSMRGRLSRDQDLAVGLDHDGGGEVVDIGFARGRLPPVPNAVSSAPSERQRTVAKSVPPAEVAAPPAATIRPSAWSATERA